MKTTFWVYLIGALALAGIFPLAGFWSKDEILAESNLFNIWIYVLLTVAAFFTAFYMGRQILMVFFGEPRSPAAEHAVESPAVMTVPLIILAGLSILGGALNLPVLHTFGHWLEHTIHIGEAAGEAEAVEAAASGGFNLGIALLSTALALAAIFIAWWLYDRRYREMQALPTAKRPDDPLRSIIGPVFTALENKWWVDELYWTIFLNPYIVFRASWPT
jgi:NADH-quinone oxidoreductase subunit L